MTRRTGAALAVLVLGAVTIAGCGGQNEADLGPPVTQPAGTSAQTSAPTTQSAKPRPRVARAGKPHARTASSAKSGTTTTKTASSVQPARKPAAKPKPSKEAPIACLAQAGLYKPAKSGDGLWSAVERKSGKPVFVDGPYKSAAEAKTSAASLVGVQDAAKGGLYVVSAAVRSNAGPVVRMVAKCLEKRR
jgi:hypothetical protein